MTQRVLAWAASTALFLSASAFAQTTPQKQQEPARAVSLIQTNAQGGSFSADKRFWFAVPDGQRLRLTVNGNETYRGAGPASSSLSVKAGEDKTFEVVAERRSAPPEDTLLESRAFVVRIDTVAPLPVQTSGSQSGGPSAPWVLRFNAEEGSRVYAVVDADSYLSSHADAAAPLSFSARRVEGLAWCVDGAGNASVPAPFSFKPFSLSIANPAPGTWANRQRLIVLQEGASELFWSDDGQDPFGPTGKRYSGGVEIDKTGPVVIRVGARSPDGREERAEVAYTAAGKDQAVLSAFADIESKPVLVETALTVPVSFRWDIGGERAVAASVQLPFPGGRDLVLRPVAGLLRYVPVYVGDGAGIHRFLIALGAEKATEVPAASASAVGLADAVSSSPQLYASGRARIIAWERKQGGIRYRWKDKGVWLDASGPVPVAAEGGDLEWIVDKGTSQEGPFVRNFPAIAAEASFPSAAPISSIPPKKVSASAVDVSAPADAEGVRFTLSAPGIEPRTVELARSAPARIDVCDGEQLSWTASGEGFSLSVKIDRRPPSPPVITAPEEGAWARDVPIVSFSVAEGRSEAVARWKDEDGKTGSYALPAQAQLRSFKKGPVEYTIEARTIDEAGNASPLVARNFTVDESTVYASAVLGSPASGAKAGDGSRAAPFSSLSSALSLARAQKRSRVRISGSVALSGRVELFDGVALEGGYGSDWKKGGGFSDIVFASDASLLLRSGTARLSALRLVESGNRGAPLFALSGSTLELSGITTSPSSAAKPNAPVLFARANASVKATDCIFLGGSPVVDAGASKLTLTECLLSATAGRDGRASALRSVDSTLRLERSRLEAGKTDAGRVPSVALGAEVRGGKLTLLKSVAEVVSSDSSTGLMVRGADLDAADSEVVSSSALYASALSLDGAEAAFVRGRLSASGRDAVALIQNDGRASKFEDSSFTVAGTGVVRAVQVKGAYPSLSSCRFVATGAPSGSEVLAGDPPSSGSVRGNRFQGFSFIYERSFDADSLTLFNRRYAGKGPANELSQHADGM